MELIWLLIGLVVGYILGFLWGCRFTCMCLKREGRLIEDTPPTKAVPEGAEQ